MKNIKIFTTFNWDTVISLIYKSRFIIATLCAAVLLFSSCKKIAASIAPSQNALEQYFGDNVLNKDFTVKLASDNGTDITAQYSGYTFKLLKNTFYDGPLTATFNQTTTNGTWSSNSDYSKLIITLPNTAASFTFLSREWRFTKKTVPVLELAPWGTTEPDILHMQRQ
jgi:hypothetical protein